MIKQLKEKHLNQIFKDYKPTKLFSLMMSVIFFIRRYIMIFCLIVIPNKVNGICLLFLVTTFFMVCYIQTVKPYDSQVKNFQEFFNELAILLSVYCMTGYTDFFNNDIDRFSVDRACEVLQFDGVYNVKHEQCPLVYLESMMATKLKIGWLSLSISGVTICANLALITI